MNFLITQQLYTIINTNNSSNYVYNSYTQLAEVPGVARGKKNYFNFFYLKKNQIFLDDVTLQTTHECLQKKFRSLHILKRQSGNGR